MRLRLLGELNDFLPREQRGQSQAITLTRRAAVKDVLEAVGVPHTEIGVLRINALAAPMSSVLVPGSDAHVLAAPATTASRRADWPDAPPAFVADVHLGGLVRRLRLAGFDVAYANDRDDADLAAISDIEHRVLLTRDRGLLKRARVRHARFVRCDATQAQYDDIVAHFGLADRMQPFTRCSDCNTPLDTVAKTDIVHRLEPLTRAHYTHFARCPVCDKLFWGGSHVADVQRRL